jgi:hypothetical protein
MVHNGYLVLNELAKSLYEPQSITEVWKNKNNKGIVLQNVNHSSIFLIYLNKLKVLLRKLIH